ncbi:MAG TPA: hypothetical protein VHL79_17480 [Ramlibacter sp.]|jgi:hypothetical protein|nr:hypothetical protein [Ramlibacter sp.]
MLLPVLLACSAAASAAAASAAAPASPSVSCRASLRIVPLPAGYPAKAQPPATDISAPAPDGSYNWSLAYQLQSMVHHLAETGDPAWGARIVEAADPLLARRDAISPRDGKPYAWLDRSAAVTTPYAWVGYAGHNFAPLMEFARVVAGNPNLGACTYAGATLKQHAARYLAEFNRVLAVHQHELVRRGGESWFVFGRVPSSSAKLDGQELPANMNAAIFTALLHAADAEQVVGEKARAAQKRTWVRQHVRHLTRSVLQRHACGERTCLRWRYATYATRSEDLGHANMVAKFLYDAYEDGYSVRRRDLVAFANTLDSLIDANGRFRGNLLDGDRIQGVTAWIPYAIVYAGLQDSLRQKISRVMAGSSEFAYAGAWLRAEAERAQRMGGVSRG